MNGFEMILPFLKPIEHLILDDSISEVMVNGPDRVFIEKQGFLQQVPGVSIGEKSLMVAVKNIARRFGDDISESKPILDSRLPDGSRVAAIIPPCSLGGVTLTIRKFNTRHFEMEDLIREGTLDRALANRLEDYVLARRNILISGGTGTGKTTLLSILGKFIPTEERILVIEDTAEIHLAQENLVRFEARREQNGLPAVAIRDLLKAALRHRPDRIVLGEIRGGEAFDLLQLLNTGHSGTLHQLCFAKRCGPPLSGHQDQHRRFAQCRRPRRAPAWTQVHLRSSPDQQLRSGRGSIRLRHGVLGQAGSRMSTDTRFIPRSLTASEYVRELFGPGDNAAILVRDRSTGHTVQTIAKAEAIASPSFQTWLANQSARGYDVFVGMNPIKDGAYSRTKANIKDIRHVYLDLDRKGDEALQTIRNSVEVPAPNFVLDTSPSKHQVVWKVTGFSQDEDESLLHSLANQFGGDLAATDSTRVLRLPGFANRKLSEEFIVQACQESDAVYMPRDFTIQEDSPETPRDIGHTQEGKRTVAREHKSQSERDWAFAKRALARGDDPEVVIQRIADYRAEDKGDPQYYASRTVRKAHDDLRHKGARVYASGQDPSPSDERSNGMSNPIP